MTQQNPLVSVVIPTYYRNDVLGAVIKSVRNQSYDPVETIVVDDSGEANAQSVVRSFDDIEYIALDENKGAQAARTIGVKNASGRYIHLLDDDDEMFPHKLTRQVEAIEESPNVGVVYTGIEMSDGRRILPTSEACGHVLAYALSFSLWPCMTSTMLIDSALLTELLPFPDRGGGHDLEMMIQLAKRTEFDYINTALLYKRVDISSLGHSFEAIEARKQIIEEYDTLYSNHSNAVRHAALANTYESQAEILLKKEGWSPQAIALLFKYVTYTPDNGLTPLVKFVAGCLGRPGWSALDRLNRTLQ